MSALPDSLTEQGLEQRHHLGQFGGAHLPSELLDLRPRLQCGAEVFGAGLSDQRGGVIGDPTDEYVPGFIVVGNDNGVIGTVHQLRCRRLLAGQIHQKCFQTDQFGAGTHSDDTMVSRIEQQCTLCIIIAYEIFMDYAHTTQRIWRP